MAILKPLNLNEMMHCRNCYWHGPLKNSRLVPDALAECPTCRCVLEKVTEAIERRKREWGTIAVTPAILREPRDPFATYRVSTNWFGYPSIFSRIHTNEVMHGYRDEVLVR